MVDVSRVRMVFSGNAVVGSSVGTLYTLGTPLGLMTAATTMLNGIKGNLPVSLTIGFQGSGEVIDVATGKATSSWAATPPTAVVGTDVGSFTQGVGYRLVWSTGTFSHGRRIKGSTYLVPVGHGGFNVAGLPNATVVSGWQTFVNSFVTAMAGNLVIVTRPSAKYPVGGHAVVTSGQVSPKVSWLTSRRT